MRIFGLTMAIAMLTLSASSEFAPVRAQQVVVQPQPYVYTYRPQTYYYPTQAKPAPVYRNRGVLPGFSKRGGIGTTPFLGNTRGMGGYSTNYSAPTRTYVPSGYPSQNYVYPRNYVAPAQTYVYPPMVGG